MHVPPRQHCCDRRCRFRPCPAPAPGQPCLPGARLPSGMNSWSRRLARRNSREQSVEIPFRIGLFVEQPVAEDPETPAPHIFDAVIVAGETGIIDRSILAPPPFGRDPFRSFEPTHLMKF